MTTVGDAYYIELDAIADLRPDANIIGMVRF